jgi:uncharacterized protein (DUF362 family)
MIDYARGLEGKNTVLIKVNFICEKTWDTGATTDPMVVEAIINKLAALPVKVYVVESDATITNADKAYVATGMKEMCDRNNIEFLNLRHVKDKVTLEIPNGITLKRIKVPRIVVESHFRDEEHVWLAAGQVQRQIPRQRHKRRRG